MFGFKAKAPVASVEDAARTWIDNSMSRLVTLFSEDALRQMRVFVPTSHDFPMEWQSLEECAEMLLCRVCSYMNVDRATLELEVFHDEAEERRYALRHLDTSWSGAAGLYVAGNEAKKTLIVLKISKTTPVESVISTIAHELCHVILLGGGKIEREEPDMELLTDLAMTFFGFGVFKANSAVRYSPYSNGGSYGYSTQKQGYMPQEMIGYSLALFAHLRGETKPTWIKYLNVDVLTYYKKSANFLRAAKDK